MAKYQVPVAKCCSICHLLKSIEVFGQNMKTLDGKQSACKDCKNKQQRESRKLAKLLGVSHDKEKTLKRSYGISLADYNVLLEIQNGYCAICGELPGTRGLGVDHDHATGNIRGLLCTNCNLGLGKFKDDLTLLLAAVDYLSDATAADEDLPLTELES